MLETLGNPYGLLGRAVFAQMGLTLRKRQCELALSAKFQRLRSACLEENYDLCPAHWYEAAEREIESLSAEEAIALHGSDDVVLVDLRDIRELQREGRVPGAFHCPRGMLEFWVDPESTYHKPVFAQDKRFVFFCAAGSALGACDAMCPAHGARPGRAHRGWFHSVEGGRRAGRDAAAAKPAPGVA